MIFFFDLKYSYFHLNVMYVANKIIFSSNIMTNNAKKKC